MRRLGQILTVLIGLAASAGIIHAGATSGEKCAVAKQKAVVKKFASKLKCTEKAILKGATADPNCLSAADTKFTAAMLKADATKGGCARTGDANSLEAVVDHAVNEIVLLTPTAQLPACQAANITCVCSNGASTSIFPGCGMATQTCSAIRDQANQSCVTAGGSADDCLALDCTDACTGQQPCG
jgi:hypothetical protein